MVAQHRTCDLCGLTVRERAVERSFGGQEKHFCCVGCAQVYQIAYENDMLDQVLPKLAPTSPRIREVVFNRGEAVHFELKGMWCAGCASAAENILRSQAGVREADVSFTAERGRIVFDPQQADPEQLLKSLDRLGYRSRNLTDPSLEASDRQQTLTVLQLITSLAFGMQVMLLYFVQLYHLYARGEFNTPDARNLQYLVWLLTTPILLFGGLSFLRGAWRAAMAHTATMDTLVALGTVSAYSYSVYVTLTGSGEAYFDSVAMITTFIMLGRYLEMLGGDQARKDIRKLLKLQPEKAWRQSQQGWEQVEAKQLAVGEIILIKAGETVPVDAEILEGAAAVDEALLTGESVPVNKEPGQTIYAGTVVTDNALMARVERPPGETRLAQITQLVEHTLSIKPPIQRMADKASAYFAFGIAAIALITALGWLAASQPVSLALLAAVAVLVVACPCALGLATPLALTTTLGRTTQAGILVRNPVSLETACQVGRAVFDKTGTLTRGKLAVASACPEPTSGLKEHEVLLLAAAVEQGSQHPIAKAILTAAPAAIPSAHDYQVLGGLGISAQIDSLGGERLMVGSARFLNVDGQTSLLEEAQSRAGQGETVVWVGWGDRVAGYITLRDEPNPQAARTIRQLQAQGVQVAMLSGDSPLTTAIIARELGLEQYEGNLSPSEKARRIQTWQAAGEKVAMAGDGVNDAPALAQADLSITVAGGTDIAGETSDIILTHPNLTLIPWFLDRSCQTRSIIRENLMWAFAYNLVTVPLAAFGLIQPVLAAATMAASSLLVVGNSLRLRR